jgi:glycosyltransferase involved in cell wall biosynthesis
MKVIVISTAPFVRKEQDFYAYSPYAKELEIWARHAGEIGFLCPVLNNGDNLLLSKLSFKVLRIFQAEAFDVKSLWSALRGLRYAFLNFYRLFQAMAWADHIHLRCPGNISLMGCVVQMFFPGKPKTAKYAGNWDPKAKQPWSYRLQRWILNNTFLTRNMKVMVYGEWENSSKNVRPFFTATYRESDKVDIGPRTPIGKIEFIFVGTLSAGKRPLYAIQLIEKLSKSGYNVSLELFGDGKEKLALEEYINNHNLEQIISLSGNQGEQIVRKAYMQSHFMILPSKSEGWPKVVAEAMFWGCFPIASKVSCVPFMVDNGNRGLLLEMNLDDDAAKIISLLNSPEEYTAKVARGIVWSRQFTLDLFENEIKKLLS